MSTENRTGRLADIPVDKIQPNPDNPRIAFRQGELDVLQESIRQYGIQVPIAVFRRGSQYILIDGERRWRCASKLNLKTIPALIQKEPKPLENLLMMFNIHALREQWDLLTIALKLPKVVKLLEQESGRSPTEIQLSARTGLSRGVIRRCRLLMALPSKYHVQLLEELKKPKSKQRLSEDLFIEMEKSLKTVSRAMPDVVSDENIDSAREVLLKKYKNDVIENITEFRKIAKIARATSVGANERDAVRAVQKLISDPSYSISRAWEDTVSEAYAERDIVSRIEGLLSRLDEVDTEQIDDDLLEKLEELVERARRILEGAA